jgi:hypothetical protein
MALIKLRKLYDLGKKWPDAKIGIKLFGEEAFDAGHPIEKKLVDSQAEPPSPAPLPDEEEIKRAQRRLAASRAGRTGRQSTILSGDDEPLG